MPVVPTAVPQPTAVVTLIVSVAAIFVAVVMAMMVARVPTMLAIVAIVVIAVAPMVARTVPISMSLTTMVVVMVLVADDALDPAVVVSRNPATLVVVICTDWRTRKQTDTDGNAQRSQPREQAATEGTSRCFFSH